jgi:hypothetical protein
VIVNFTKKSGEDLGRQFPVLIAEARQDKPVGAPRGRFYGFEKLAPFLR